MYTLVGFGDIMRKKGGSVMDKFAVQALEEYNSDTKTVRRGGFGRPFWNIHSSQFMFVPELQFPIIPGAVKYVYTAVDSNGDAHTFESKSSSAELTPIWKDIAPGMVELKVEAIHQIDDKKYLAGARTFCKMEPFPGREDLPAKACSYKECAIDAFRFVFNDETNQYWLEKGMPKPDYYHNVYPSKTYSSVINAMVTYAELEPENAEKALKIATNIADYLMSITYGEDSALAGLPPTYSFKDIDAELATKIAPSAAERRDMLMVIYPASVGCAYLTLEKATGDKKYYDAAMKIANFYKETVLDNGSWYLMLSAITGKAEAQNCCGEFGILDFLIRVYERTGDECWHKLERNYFEYIKETRLETYNWEGQFEDTKLAANYNNLTHFAAGRMAMYFAQNYSSDADKMEIAAELVRYVEDQFVVWGEFSPMKRYNTPGQHWYSPAGLEQYEWYVPIDGSTASIAKVFLTMYDATGDELYREKAYALGDSITRMQNKETGIIPTHWFDTNCSTEIRLFWMNCHIGTAFVMLELSKANNEI